MFLLVFELLPKIAKFARHRANFGRTCRRLLSATQPSGQRHRHRFDLAPHYVKFDHIPQFRARLNQNWSDLASLLLQFSSSLASSAPVARLGAHAPGTGFEHALWAPTPGTPSKHAPHFGHTRGMHSKRALGSHRTRGPRADEQIKIGTHVHSAHLSRRRWQYPARTLQASCSVTESADKIRAKRAVVPLGSAP